MLFDNRPPINLDNAEKLAEVGRDGGAYHGIGHNCYTVHQGKKLHLVHDYSSGCEYNNRVDHTCEHLGMFADVAALAEWLRKQPVAEGRYPWWCSELLDTLKVPAEEA
jgi:hypothetical protein